MGKLADEFVAPPLSVLDARQGYWRDRKRAWADLGLCDSRGRQGCLLPSTHAIKGTSAYVTGCPTMTQTTSIFDPVLAEVIVSWFSSPGSSIADPFAGGPVRGIVASVLGRRYTGIDIRQEQVDADVDASGYVHGEHVPRYVVGDSASLLADLGETYDLVMTCPPYFSLERYSDDPHDLSQMDDIDFRDAYRAVISACADVLVPCGYAAFVVGDVRDRAGMWRGLPELTVSAFSDAGMGLYDRITYIEPYGTAPLRAGRQFRASRKVVGVSEQLLVFRRG
jgi:SAM-dependent methyltransferase